MAQISPHLLKELLDRPDFKAEMAKRYAAIRQQRQISAELADPVKWIETHFYIPELNGPIVLYPHQQAVLREAHRRDASGRFVYDIVVWSDLKKSAKSSVAAAVVLYRAHLFNWGSLKIVANDLKQADSRVAYYLRRAIELNPRMEGIKQRGYKTTLPNSTNIEAIPIDPGGEAGGTDHFIVFSELWAAKHKALQQMWTEMTLSPTLYGYSQRWVETYAGYVGESPILEDLHRRGVEKGKQLDLSYTDENGIHHDLSDLEVFANGRMLCMWNTRPRLPWQTKEYYESEAAVLQEDEFMRIHRNQWVTSTSAFVPPVFWQQCEGDPGPLANRKPCIMGVDAAVSGDCFGLVLVSQDNGGDVRVHYARKWEPPKGGKIDYQGTPGNPGPELVIRDLCRRFNVSEVRYDPYQLHDMASRLGKEGVAPFAEFTQASMRLRADKQLHDRIRDGRLIHAGNPDLTQHIYNANKKETGDNKLRIIKREDGKPIDLAVALSMASYDPDVDMKRTARVI